MTVRDFNQAAATWDDKPERRAMGLAIADGIRRDVPLQAQWRIMEYGCGTATLGIMLASHVREVVAADAAKGMIEQTRKKLAATTIKNVTPLQLDLSKPSPSPVPPGKFDLITTAMVLHHVEHIDMLLKQFTALLSPGGWLAIADLCQEDGSFHGEFQVPHHGFAPADLVARLDRFHCQYHIVHQLQKNAKTYDIFLLTAQSPPLR
ncbi:MAG: class I SAM-dependent methyltransferase [Phycisphaerales bacterium]|nr:class I SAM-dependent methyltransferase [Phycisphaerales bacterium]